MSKPKLSSDSKQPRGPDADTSRRLLACYRRFANIELIEFDAILSTWIRAPQILQFPLNTGKWPWGLGASRSLSC